jgi:hypothetical protein
MPTALIPPTSNIVERFFSITKLTYDELHRSLLVETLETILFLRVNKNYWNQQTIQVLILAESRNKLKMKRKMDEDN